MSEGVCAGRWTAVSRIVLVGLMGGAVSACSSDTMRFSEAFTNPFSASERVASNEPAAPQQTWPRVGSDRARAVAVAAADPVSAARAGPGCARPGRERAGDGGRPAGRRRAGRGSRSHPNDNLNAISSRYGVPASAILSANGLSSPSQIAPGAQIVIPVYQRRRRHRSHSGRCRPADAARASRNSVSWKGQSRQRPRSADAADKSRRGCAPGMAAAPIEPALAKAPAGGSAQAGASQDPPARGRPAADGGSNRTAAGQAGRPAYAPQPAPPAGNRQGPIVRSPTRRGRSAAISAGRRAARSSPGSVPTAETRASTSRCPKGPR